MRRKEGGPGGDGACDGHPPEQEEQGQEEQGQEEEGQEEQGQEEEGQEEEHLLVVARQDNGELAEDVVARIEVETGQGDVEATVERLVETHELPGTSRRRRPDEPVPGTIECEAVQGSTAPVREGG